MVLCRLQQGRAQDVDSLAQLQYVEVSSNLRVFDGKRKVIREKKNRAAVLDDEWIFKFEFAPERLHFTAGLARAEDERNPRRLQPPQHRKARLITVGLLVE